MGKQKSLTEKQVIRQLNNHISDTKIDLILRKTKNTKQFKLLWNLIDGTPVQYIGHFTQQCVDHGIKMIYNVNI